MNRLKRVLAFVLEIVFAFAVTVNALAAEDKSKDNISQVNLAQFERMGTYDWNQLKSTFSAGVIIISKDQSTVLRHGHAAICFTSTYIVEHPGVGEKSRGIPVEEAFRDLGAVATFAPNDATTSQMRRAANYAYNNLIDWDYYLLADRDSPNKMNCATLVWKAYNYVDVPVCEEGSGTITPGQLDYDGYNTLLYQTAQYGGASWILSEGEVIK